MSRRPAELDLRSLLVPILPLLRDRNLASYQLGYLAAEQNADARQPSQLAVMSS